MPDLPPAGSPAVSTASNNERMLELGGGLVLVLALGGAAVAMTRRRRQDEEEEWQGDEALSHDHDEPAAISETVEAPAVPEVHDDIVADEQPALVAPPLSAFAWGNPEGPDSQVKDENAADDRRPDETWVERAYRGPSANNPSLSLKKRLKRAAFFDRRERESAEGRAVPVDADAGLPEAATTSEDELVLA